MSYIIYKGVNSNTINGLLICELPPVSMPQKRVNITEIDGKDGDIIDELGYKAYDRTVRVALTRNYDINTVIKYFSGNGTLVLSNEPDKVYNAAIYSKIDYEKLLRFKTADIKFHVQPYKYKLNEQSVDVSISSQESVTITNHGLEIAKPIMTLYGSGIITIALDGNDVFSVDLGTEEEYITINSLDEEAYKGSILKNRLMSGNFPKLEVGNNIITWTGNLTRIVVEPKSRWL